MSTLYDDPDAAAAAHVHSEPAHPWPTDRAGWDAVADCHGCGLAMLDLHRRSAEWVRRRVEHVAFLDDRTVRRRMSVDYVTPSPGEAVSFRRGRETVRVIPLTIMRRKSLVKFDLRNEQGAPLPLLGLREAQSLTLAVARAWAAAALAGTATVLEPLRPAVDAVITAIVAGDQQELEDAYLRYDSAGRGAPEIEGVAEHDIADLAVLARDQHFRSVLERFAGSFLLFTLDAAPTGSRRIIKFAYDEPLTLHHRTSSYRGHAHGPLDGLPGQAPGDRLSYGRTGHWLKPRDRVPKRAALGWMPTVIRFPIPAAELSASFHLEVQAPPHVTILEASLLAGRPNLSRSEANDPAEDRAAWAAAGEERRRRPSFDLVGGGYPTVDLHVADVPFGSLSRAQVKLQADTKGWLATATAATWLTFALLLALAIANPSGSEVAGTVLLSFSAAVVAMIARSDNHGMTARLLSRLRGLATLSSLLMLVAAVGLLVSGKGGDQLVLIVCAGLSAIPAMALLTSWWLARGALSQASIPRWLRDSQWAGPLVAKVRPEDMEHIRLSPWEQHLPDDTPDARASSDYHVGVANGLIAAPYPYDHAVVKLHFDKPAIKVASAEGARSKFIWTADYEREFRTRMDAALRCAGHGAEPRDRNGAVR